MNEYSQGAAAPKYRKVRYAERWEILRDIMVRIYIDEKTKLKNLVEIMKRDYQFHATEGQYKVKFKQWKVGKAIPTETKEVISKVLQSRAQLGKSLGILYRDRPVEIKTIRRHLKEQVRRDIAAGPGQKFSSDVDDLSGHALQCGARIFINWHVPYSVFQCQKVKPSQWEWPFGETSIPLKDIRVASSMSNIGQRPKDPQSPTRYDLTLCESPSQIAVTIQDKIRVDRALLFARGEHVKMLALMSEADRHIMIDWLNQFWLFSFKSAKTWGRRPRRWSANTLGLTNFPEKMLTGAPSLLAFDHNSDKCHRGAPNGGASSIERPSQLCLFSIHEREDEDNDSVESEDLEEPGIQWRDDADSTSQPSRKRPGQGGFEQFSEEFQTSFENNHFSTICPSNLPVSPTQTALFASRSPDRLREEAFCFSIMGRNEDLVHDFLRNMDRNFSFHEVYPLHLAASYLDGGRTCCNVFHAIAVRLPAGDALASARKLYENHLGHTVLDNLMIAILKAHTSCTPGIVDDTFKNEPRFVGEEVDICGRWDADSDCIRQLHAQGNAAIPFDWKHMFCHTSVQAISDCIGSLTSTGTDINSFSGLFVRRCSKESCGLKLQLRPLHTLVVTAVHLAHQGCEGETLFGILTCLLRLMWSGVNPLLTADVSVKALLNIDNEMECTHSILTASELAKQVPPAMIDNWSHSADVGWKVFCHVLSMCEADARYIETALAQNDSTDGFAEDCGIYFKCMAHGAYRSQPLFFGSTIKKLQTLWSAVRTEVATYRRKTDGDPWMSDHFDMESLLGSLETYGDLGIGLVQNCMMKDTCNSCGSFEDFEEVLGPQNVSMFCFTNMGDWTSSTQFQDSSRSTYIHQHEDL